jgi:hypothetical protein
MQKNDPQENARPTAIPAPTGCRLRILEWRNGTRSLRAPSTQRAGGLSEIRRAPVILCGFNTEIQLCFVLQFD